MYNIETFTESELAADFILKYFLYDKVPAEKQNVCLPFASMAKHIISTVPRSPERTVSLRKLLESMDAAVRAAELD